MAPRKTLIVPSSMASFRVSRAVSRAGGRDTSKYLAFSMSFLSFSIRLDVSRSINAFWINASVSPCSARLSSMDANDSFSRATISSILNTTTLCVPNAAASCSFTTILFTSVLLKFSGLGRASYSFLVSSSNSAISSSVSPSINSLEYSFISLLSSNICCRFSSRKFVFASRASCSRAVLASAAASSRASRLARRSSASNDFRALMRILKFSSTTA
mmetsp:Transcript_12984/g.18139  ORF Transcript_12984/g.18139 Transcript_12984/m.18139 type:complete len:216 (+) Transcript_12984:925-1572(+)